LGRRFAFWILGIAAFTVILVRGPGFLAFCARQVAARQMDQFACSAALPWLDRADRLAPRDGRTNLLRAACFRQLEQMDRWSQALQAAERKGAPAAEQQLELKLGLLRAGRIGAREESHLGELVQAGAALHDVMAVFVHGYLAQGEFGKARLLLDNWQTAHPEVAHAMYMRGVYLCRLDESARALGELEKALARQPRHEPALRLAVQVCEGGDWLDQALPYTIRLAEQSREDPAAMLALARVLRKLGRVDDARSVLKSQTACQTPPTEAVMEMGRIEFESGHYQEAERWFTQVLAAAQPDHQELLAVATALAFSGDTAGTERLFARYATVTGNAARQRDLEARLAFDPRDAQAAEELQRLSSDSAASATHHNRTADTQPPQPLQPPPQADAHTGPELYAAHCSACHGRDGGGDGPAAWHLFPRPRDLRRERFRLVSTQTGVASLDDLISVTRQGMPGSSMPPFQDLTDAQHALLAREVLRLQRDGVRNQLVAVFSDQGEEIDEGELHQIVAGRTTSGEPAVIPSIGPADPDAIARGGTVYVQLECGRCHGDDGSGATDLLLVDDAGNPTRARDLVYEPFKGGMEPELIYLRISLGMPGSAHPASGSVPQEQLIDLVHYCRSLSREPKRTLTNHQRSMLATGRSYLAEFGAAAINQ
jgi:mono/diheme cytochrome c family protein